MGGLLFLLCHMFQDWHIVQLHLNHLDLPVPAKMLLQILFHLFSDFFGCCNPGNKRFCILWFHSIAPDFLLVLLPYL